MSDPCDFCIYNCDSLICESCFYNPDLLDGFLVRTPASAKDVSLNFAKDGSGRNLDDHFYLHPDYVPF